MNYIIEINRFYDWLETNPLTDSSIVLWHALMHINNKCGWKQEFAVAISTLELKTGLSKSSILRSRNVLVQTGRILFKSRNGQLSAVYSMVSLHSDAQGDTQSGTQTVTQTGAQSGTQTVPINKLKKSKLNENSSTVAVAPVKKKEVTLYWEGIVKTWFDFYGTHFKNETGEPTKPIFNGAQASQLKKISENLKKLALLAGKEWNEAYASVCVKGFLQRSWEHDEWVRQNFELGNLLNKFNSITNKNSNGTATNQSFGKTNTIKLGTSAARTEAARNF